MFIKDSFYCMSRSWENLFKLYANNKSADQPAHARSLISPFVVHCLDSMIPLVSISKISSLYLASMAVQADLHITRSQTLKTGFLMMRLILYMHYLYKYIRYNTVWITHTEPENFNLVLRGLVYLIWNFTMLWIVKPLGPWKPNFMQSFYGLEVQKIVWTVLVIWLRRLSCPYMVKTLLKSSSLNQQADDLWTSRLMTFELGIQHQRLGPYKVCSNLLQNPYHWNLGYSTGGIGPAKFVLMMILGWPWPYFMARSTLLPNAFVWENA